MKFEATSVRWSIASILNRLGRLLDLEPEATFGLWRTSTEGTKPEVGPAAVGRVRLELALGESAWGKQSIAEGPVLIDAMWRNPNCWLRIALIRAALGTVRLEEHAFTGRFKSREQEASGRNLGISCATNIARARVNFVNTCARRVNCWRRSTIRPTYSSNAFRTEF